MKESIKNFLKEAFLFIRTNLLGIDRKIIDDYFSNYKIRKLHIGCDRHILKGWLNSDLYPRTKQVLRLDVKKSFPFMNDEFDYVFSEHMIEHITYSQGLQMLSECHRILRRGGRLRISTPNLLFLMDLYKSEKSELQKAYLKWVTDNFIKEAPYYGGTFVINYFVRHWGHKFIYDEKALRYSLEKAGFTEIVKCRISDSQDKELQGLENEERMPVGFLGLESIVLEATKA